jgi:hypothetical protein
MAAAVLFLLVVLANLALLAGWQFPLQASRPVGHE